jgi:hypothetical protein
VVTYLVGAAGITQFLDLGSGIPTAGNVHEIAQQHSPGAKVVYIDLDPVAVTMSHRLLAGNPDATAVRGDVRDIGPILTHPDVTGLLDFDRPIAVLALAVLPAIPDTAAMRTTFATLRQTLAPGSYLALSHISSETPPGPTDQFVTVSRKTPTPGTIRSRADIAAFFDGFAFVEPGLVDLTAWRPDSSEAPTPVVMLGGVAITEGSGTAAVGSTATSSGS